MAKKIKVINEFGMEIEVEEYNIKEIKNDTRTGNQAGREYPREIKTGHRVTRET
jgi:hypothetical protein